MMNATPSLADIAAVTDGNRNNDGFGNGNGWWVLIILFAIFGGWGNGAWGRNGAGEAPASNGDLQRGFDTQSMLNKLNGINSGMCDGFYAMNTSLLQGFNGTQQAINADTVANMQNTNALSTQLAQCCCENRQGQAQIQYDMATNTCAIQNAIQNQTQQIIQNDNANYRQLHDEIVANRMEDLKSKIADQAQEINQLNLSASQCQQNAYLISQLRPNPVPAFQVANPFASMYTGCCSNNVAI